MLHMHIMAETSQQKGRKIFGEIFRLLSQLENPLGEKSATLTVWSQSEANDSQEGEFSYKWITLLFKPLTE